MKQNYAQTFMVSYFHHGDVAYTPRIFKTGKTHLRSFSWKSMSVQTLDADKNSTCLQKVEKQ